MKDIIKLKISVSPFLVTRKLGRYTSQSVNIISGKGINKWNKFNEERMEREIYNSCIILKNLAIVQCDMPMSLDYIMEELSESSIFLKTVYNQILLSWRNGKGDDSFKVLSEIVDTRSARYFVNILCKIDKINPAELVSTMEAFLETFTGERITKAIKRTERKGIITTMFSTASIFAILMNFAVVVVFMDTLNMLGQYF